jgi:hypothetical protein
LSFSELQFAAKKKILIFVLDFGFWDVRIVRTKRYPAVVLKETALKEIALKEIAVVELLVLVVDSVVDAVDVEMVAVSVAVSEEVLLAQREERLPLPPLLLTAFPLLENKCLLEM